MGDLFRSSSFASSTMTFHPVVHLVTSEYPCQCVCWCAHDDNYIFTGQSASGRDLQYLSYCSCVGGLDKMACLWDVRQPFSPIDKMEKGMHTHTLKAFLAQWYLLIRTGGSRFVLCREVVLFLR